MRSYNNLYEPMLQDDYIKQRFINASKKKKNRNDVREVLENLDEHTELLKKMLTEELFIPDYHKPSIINESSSKKTRRILKPHYKYEQVIHHCAIGQFKPIVMNGLYEFSCGSIPDRGVHYGKKYMRKWLDSYDGKKFFVLKMDVHHFFESINRRILKRKLKAVIRDKRFYRLLCILIEHDKIALVAKILTDAGVEIDAEQTKTLVGCIAFDDISGALEVLREIGIAGAMFEELKIIIEEMRKGVPLGYFTSQWFGNFYLKALDHYIKEELHAEHYMRYMDDMVILGKSKKKLHKMHRAIETYLNDNLDLEIKGDWQVFRFEYPVFDKGGNPVLDKDGKQVLPGARGLKDITEITAAYVIPELAECKFRVACDVTNPLCGELGCSAIYGPQKGATPEMIQDMDQWLGAYAELAKERFPKADPKYPGTGAAGGMGFAFLTFTDAVLESGINIVLDETKLEDYIKDADLVITGEGRMDGQTAMGKAPVGVAKLAKKYGKKVIAFAGAVQRDARACNDAGIDAFFPILRGVVTLEEAMKSENAKRNLADTAEQVIRLMK